MRRAHVNGMLIPVRWVLLSGVVALGLLPSLSRAQEASGVADQAPAKGAPAGSEKPLFDSASAPPPPPNVVYLQYGVAVTAEIPLSPGPICDNSSIPCILGTGGGLAIRVGGRGAGPIYIGLAYEAAKLDANKLYRLGLLQQARAELRYYYVTGRRVEPYALLGVGAAAYGNQWNFDTFGPTGVAGIGFETQISRRTVVGVALDYRLAWLKSFTDTSGADRDSGVAQIFGFDLVLENRDPISSRPQ